MGYNPLEVILLQKKVINNKLYTPMGYNPSEVLLLQKKLKKK